MDTVFEMDIVSESGELGEGTDVFGIVSDLMTARRFGLGIHNYLQSEGTNPCTNPTLTVDVDGDYSATNIDDVTHAIIYEWGYTGNCFIILYKTQEVAMRRFHENFGVLGVGATRGLFVINSDGCIDSGEPRQWAGYNVRPRATLKIAAKEVSRDFLSLYFRGHV